MTDLRVLAVGLGGMGLAHARAAKATPGLALAGIVTRGNSAIPPDLAGVPHRIGFDAALQEFAPDLVLVSTFTDSHAPYAIRALEAGAHVFVEKPLAATVAEAEAVIAAAQKAGRALVVGHILQHHPLWQRFVAESRALGGPYVFRIGLNQPSDGLLWRKHRELMRQTSPLVDCGVHYVDVMLRITDAAPVEVRGMGLRLSADIAPGMYNYGHLQLSFDDGSVGWHEAGWGPMVSATDSFTRDVVAPSGAVSMTGSGGSARLELRDAALDGSGTRLRADRSIPADPGFDHAALCRAQMDFVLRAARGRVDLAPHHRAVLQALRICFAADESIRIGAPVRL